MRVLGLGLILVLIFCAFCISVCAGAQADTITYQAWTDSDNDGLPIQVDPDDATAQSYGTAVLVELAMATSWSMVVGSALDLTFTVTQDVPLDLAGVAFTLGDATPSWMAHGWVTGDFDVGTTYTATIPAAFLVSGTWDLATPGTYALTARLYGGGFATSVVAATVTVTGAPAVPEPAAIVLFGLGTAGLALRGRRRLRAW